jgi:hypothetical protein
MACMETNLFLVQTNYLFYSELGKCGTTFDTNTFEISKQEWCYLNDSTNTITLPIIMGDSSPHNLTSSPRGAFPSSLTTIILHTFITSSCMLRAMQFSTLLFDSTAIMMTNTKYGVPHCAINPFRSYVGPRPTLWFSCSRILSLSLPFPIQFFCHPHYPQLLFILGGKEVDELLVIILQF